MPNKHIEIKLGVREFERKNILIQPRDKLIGTIFVTNDRFTMKMFEVIDVASGQFPYQLKLLKVFNPRSEVWEEHKGITYDEVSGRWFINKAIFVQKHEINI